MISELKSKLELKLEKDTKRELQTDLESYIEKRSFYIRKIEELIPEYIDMLTIVPGTQEQFERLAGYAVEIVDLGMPNKGALIVQLRGERYDGNFPASEYRTSPHLLMEKGVVGMINANLTQSDWDSQYSSGTERIYLGLPVAKKGNVGSRTSK